MKLSFKKKAGACLLAVCMLAGVPMSVTAETLDDIKAEQTRLAEEKTALEAKLAELENDEAEKVAYQQNLEEQIKVVQEQIDSARSSIETLNTSIAELTAQLDDSQADIGETMDTFKKRITALYKGGSVDMLSILLNADSFADFSIRSEALKGVSKHDQEVIDKIAAYMEETKDERKECEDKKAEVAELQKTLETKQSEIGDLQAANEAALAELAVAQENTVATIAENEAQGQAAIGRAEALIAQQKAFEEEQRRLAEEEQKRQQEIWEQNQNNNNNGGETNGDTGSGDSGDTSGGSSGDTGSGDGSNPGPIAPPSSGGVAGFNPVWPLPGVTYISCYYGDGGHRGLDIAGSYGTPIVAAESGTVIEGNNYDEWGDSWGYYVLIYHNGTYTTRYAHMSSLAVSTGDTVTQGQIIGYEGSTGNSTGPHLHFEVYENGSRVDPGPFLGLY